MEVLIFHYLRHIIFEIKIRIYYFNLIFFFLIDTYLKKLFETLVTGTQIVGFQEMMPIEEWIRLR